MPSWTARYSAANPAEAVRVVRELDALRQDPNCVRCDVSEDPNTFGVLQVGVDFATAGPSETSIAILRRGGAEAVPAVRMGPLGIPSMWADLQVSELRPRTVHPDEAAARVRESQAQQRPPGSVRVIQDARVPPGHVFMVTEPHRVTPEEFASLVATPFTERGIVGFPPQTETTHTTANPGWSMYEEEGGFEVNPRVFERLYQGQFPEAVDRASQEMSRLDRDRFNAQYMAQQIMAEEDRRIFEALDRVASEPGYLQMDRVRVPDFIVSTNPCAEIPLGTHEMPRTPEPAETTVPRTRFERIDEE